MIHGMTSKFTTSLVSLEHVLKRFSKCIHLDEYFDFRNHPCLVSELYGMSVFDFLKQNGFQPFPDKHIQDFAKSLLRSMSCK